MVVPFEIGLITQQHSDDRRIISEFNGVNFSVQHFIVGSNPQPLGNHYHERKTETFVIISGGGKVALCPTGDQPDQRKIFELSAGSVIHIEERVGHTFWLDPGTIMVNFSSAPFDPDNQDLNKMVLTLD